MNDITAAILKAYQKSASVNQCATTSRTILPNFIPIGSEVMEP